jgi:uncharacterized protein (TIGR00251 family)
MSTPYLREVDNGVYLALKVQPRASRNKIGDVHGAELKISITAPPVDSAANEALLNFLREVLDCPRANIEITRGHTSRHKTVFVRNIPSASILERLTKA